ncbi:MAG: hypothetical protein KIT74_10095 [Fimbriimonadales bacterium]|nr:hypothetical protein [Fimbriimonadales bacterium]
MKVMIATLALLAIGCHSGIEQQDSLSSLEHELFPISDQLALGSPVVRGNVAIVPVLSMNEAEPTVQREIDDYVLLHEATKNGWVEITEIPGSATVSELLVRNLGPKPLLLLAGDVLLGGKQDRIVAKDTLVPPKDAKRVSVFCVERGRWHGKSMSFEGSPAAAPISVRDAAVYKDQSAVWDSVAESNQELAESPTSTSVQESANSEWVRSTLATDFDPLMEALAGDRRMVGAVLLINGQIVSLELFGSNSLFLRGIGPIVRGLLIESAAAPKGGDRRVDTDECAAFVRAALRADRNQTSLSPEMAQSRVQGEKVQGVESMTPSSSNDSQELMRGTYSPR